MKTKKFALILMALFLVTAWEGCKKDILVTGGFLSLKVDGDRWDATVALTSGYASGMLGIMGTDDIGNSVLLNLDSAFIAGTYPIGSNGSSGNTAIWQVGTGNNDSYFASPTVGSGSITLSEISATKAVGTFEFTAKNANGDTKVITKGKFSADY